MSQEKKLLIKRMGEYWREELPMFKCIHIKETPQIPKGCNFICEKYFETRKMFYFLQIDFLPQIQGEFSIIIVITPDRNRSVLSHGPSGSLINSTSIGMYAIWQFCGVSTQNWSLIDVDALFMESLGAMPGLKNSKNWEPSTYNQPIELIVEEAVINVTDIIKTKVLPVLDI